MSFSVANPSIGLEYNGHNLNTLFAQRGNLLRGSFHRMLLDILRFNRAARRRMNRGGAMETTVGEFVRRQRFGRLFADNYLLPMVAAIWSCDPRGAEAFPMTMLARFFANHGLLDLFNRPRWFTIAGGSRNYVRALTADFAGRIHLSTPVRGVSRGPSSVKLRFDNGSEDFDQVVLACHSDQALALLESPTQAETEILGAIPYRPNSVLLHRDASLMPRQRRAWASWNYRTPRETGRPVAVTYNLTRLQSLPTRTAYCVSLNLEDAIDERRVIARFDFHHPLFDEAAVAAQARHAEVSGAGRIHYCGAYWGHGFHEDGVVSALAVARRLGVAV